MKTVDTCGAPRVEDRLMELQDTFSLGKNAASWLYSAIVFARPIIQKIKSVQVVDSSTLTGKPPTGSRQDDEYTYIIVR